MEREAAEDADDFSFVNEERNSPPVPPSQLQPPPASSSATAPKLRNAFTELMTRRPSETSSAPTTAPRNSPRRPTFPKSPNWRAGLLSYVQNPAGHPEAVVRVTADTVLIKDLYPKAALHLLVLPRNPVFYNQHPFEAFQDAAFLAAVRRDAEAAVRLAAAELERRFGRVSASNAARSAAIDARFNSGGGGGGSSSSDGDQDQDVSSVVPGNNASDDEPPPPLPEGRDWLRELRVGVHAHPSMQHLHVHVASRDMCAAALRKRTHYNSFNTPFFVPLADFPLAPDDERRRPHVQNANLKRDLLCWRCGAAFGNRFADLKRHLEVEFEEWKRE